MSTDATVRVTRPTWCDIDAKWAEYRDALEEAWARMCGDAAADRPERAS